MPVLEGALTLWRPALQTAVPAAKVVALAAGRVHGFEDLPYDFAEEPEKAISGSLSMMRWWFLHKKYNRHWCFLCF